MQCYGEHDGKGWFNAHTCTLSKKIARTQNYDGWMIGLGKIYVDLDNAREWGVLGVGDNDDFTLKPRGEIGERLRGGSRPSYRPHDMANLSEGLPQIIKDQELVVRSSSGPRKVKAQSLLTALRYVQALPDGYPTSPLPAHLAHHTYPFRDTFVLCMRV